MMFLIEDYDIECSSQEHYDYSYGVFLPFILIWMVVYPLILFAIMFKNRKRLTDPNVKETFSFIYRGYKLDKFYWEIVIMARKYAMVAIVTAFQETSLQIYTCIYVIWLSIYA